LKEKNERMKILLKLDLCDVWGIEKSGTLKNEKMSNVRK
jgi:hypothetical protein